ncbi:MAG: BMP family ABC transporter substrate-binding protein [Ruminococcaceae bacterium]|nr:BMP family ABC transporter substrate-binding protein [Oscillospiraceae bacterium]
MRKILSLFSCSKKAERPVDAEKSSAPSEGTAETGTEAGEVPKSACLISQYGLDSPFIAMCWEGFTALEEQGWKVKFLQVSETTEFADQIRAMAADDWGVIVTLFDALAATAVELSGELEESYPGRWIFLCDSYEENNTNNCANIICDPWESSFVAGFVAAHSTEKKNVGWIGHTNSPTQDRFIYGYEAGIKYADTGVGLVYAYTGDAQDTLKGKETAKTMIQNEGVDIIYQAANTSGIGVIEECKQSGIKCIGVDMWQGGEYGQETVFWSALKPIQDAITDCCIQAQAGEWSGNMMFYDLAHGAAVYDERDFALLPEELQKKVEKLVSDISDGTIDVYEGYEEYRPEF